MSLSANIYPNMLGNSCDRMRLLNCAFKLSAFKLKSARNDIMPPGYLEGGWRPAGGQAMGAPPRRARCGTMGMDRGPAGRPGRGGAAAGRQEVRGPHARRPESCTQQHRLRYVARERAGPPSLRASSVRRCCAYRDFDLFCFVLFFNCKTAGYFEFFKLSKSCDRSTTAAEQSIWQSSGGQVTKR
jgi:hypothetical protein